MCSRSPGVDLTDEQPQLVIERTDYTPESRFGDVNAVVARSSGAQRRMA